MTQNDHEMTFNDLEMTFNDLEMTLRPKTTTPLCAPWKNLQKLSNILSPNSYSSRFIDEDYVLIFITLDSKTVSVCHAWR